jgi:SNF2 family DNA or RNA helicase
MPKSLLKKNVDELLRFTDFRPEDIVIVDGTPKQRAQAMQRDAKVFLMGFDRWKADWKNLLDIHKDIDACVVDEFHMGFGGHTSQRTQALYESLRHIKHFVAMTGTLIRGKLDSAYPAIHIIEPRYYFSHEDFLNQHMLKDYFGNKIGWTGHQKLADILGTHAIRRSFQEVYGAEAKVIQIELCEMGVKQREVYEQFEAEALLELEDRFLDGTAPGVHAIRCRQLMAHPERVELPELVGVDPITNKPIYIKKMYNLIGKELTGKDERLLVHIEDHKNTGSPFLVFASLVPEQERIAELCRKNGLRVGLINGNVSTKERVRFDEEFRAGKLDVIVGSPATMAVGFNWGHLDHVIFASLDYMDDSFKQAYRRAIRGVRTKPLLITVLEYRDSIDQRIFAIVDQKAKDANLVDPTQEKLNLSQVELETAAKIAETPKPPPATFKPPKVLGKGVSALMSF